MGSLVAILPIKRFDRAKCRLAPVFGPDERAAFAEAMAHDVLTALAQARRLTDIVVVTDHIGPRDMAREFGARVMTETLAGGTNAAVALAVESIKVDQTSGVIVVPADIPHLQPADIDALTASMEREDTIALVPANRDGGTNALGLAPPDRLPTRFGPDSFRRHVAHAKAIGLMPQIIRNERLGLDLDVPSDLIEFFALGSATRAHAVLAECDLIARWTDHQRKSTLVPTEHPPRAGVMPAGA